ncbi:Uncharacterised protein [Collinsella intestinalis]|nr:Uncharacterised protein [Collinsella intestinalis]
MPSVQIEANRSHATAPNTFSSSVACASLRWIVLPSPKEYLSLSVTVRPASPRRRSLAPTDSESSCIAALTSLGSVRSCAKVRSLLTDLTSSGASMARTSLTSSPAALRRTSSALMPKIGQRRPSDASASCPSVRIPTRASALSAAAPMPLMARTGSGARNPCSVPGVTMVSPRGLSRSLAIFATVLLRPSPIEQVTPSSETRRLMRCAI